MSRAIDKNGQSIQYTNIFKKPARPFLARLQVPEDHFSKTEVYIMVILHLYAGMWLTADQKAYLPVMKCEKWLIWNFDRLKKDLKKQ